MVLGATSGHVGRAFQVRGLLATAGFVRGCACGTSGGMNWRPAVPAPGRTTTRLICRDFYGSDGTRPRGLRRDRPAFRSPARVPMVALSYWRTGCRVLGKVLGELTRRVGKP